MLPFQHIFGGPGIPGMPGMFDQEMFRPLATQGSFTEHLRAFPVTMMEHRAGDNAEVNYSGKIMLPPSALNKLSMLHIEYPMLFRLYNEHAELSTHCGVLEFVAEEGRVYLPNWMMKQLLLEPGDILRVQNISLPGGSFIKIQPQSVDFLDITDPKAVLEFALSKYSTITKGDIVELNYNNKVYELLMLELKPEGRAISIVDRDIEVDFAPPVGYVEPERPDRSKESYMIPSGSSLLSRQKIILPKDVKLAQEKQKQTEQPIASDSKATKKRKKAQSATVSLAEFDFPEDPFLNDVFVRPPPLPLRLGQLFFGYNKLIARSLETEEDAEQGKAAKDSKKEKKGKKGKEKT